MAAVGRPKSEIPKETLAIYVSKEVADRVRAVAEASRWPVSQAGSVLLEEALAAREHAAA